MNVKTFYRGMLGGMYKMIRAERLYNTTSNDGFRILVDRLWPRGIRKEELKIDLWLKDIGPSGDLRKWFGHDPSKWNEFRYKFFLELDQKKELVDLIVEKAKERDIVLLFGTKNVEHNNAVALKAYIEQKMKDKAD